jgi:hypothetical protein
VRAKKTLISLMIAGSVVGFGAACETASDQSEPKQKPQNQSEQKQKEGQEPDVSQGVGSKDATKDVTMGEPKVDEYGSVTVPVTVKNHTSKASDYMIEANIFDSNGTQLTTAMGFAWRVAPGDTAKTNLISMVDFGVDDVTAKLTVVERTASY